jgi:catechol 2,3-dioxygenase-like lactoylglutathione lyase family enzyme
VTGQERGRAKVGIVGLDHVQLAMPAGGEEDARRFYGGLLGLREVAKPAELAGRGGCWFVGPGLALHLGVDEPFEAATQAHPGLLVADLDAGRQALTAAGVPVVDDSSGAPIRRCYTADPFGNRIELIDARDAGFTNRTGDGP